MQANHRLPHVFVWTKFGIEAGERVPDIIRRKEEERLANDGLFLWGVGTNVGPSIGILTTHGAPEVLFSPIVSTPRACDVSPEGILAWTEAETLDGKPFEIPAGSLVTSRGGSKRRFHYALVCYSENPLRITESTGTVCSAALRNLASGKLVGSSQVTSVVKNHAKNSAGRAYPISMRIELRAPYFVRLMNPVQFEDLPTRSGRRREKDLLERAIHLEDPRRRECVATRGARQLVCP